MDRSESDRPAPDSDVGGEIKITPEMREAGAMELAGYSDFFGDSLEDVVGRIFLAMCRARQNTKPGGGGC